MAHHHHVNAHRLNVLGGINERLALADAGAAGREIVRVGAETLGRESETGPRARGRLEEQVDDDLAFEVAALRAEPPSRFDKPLGRVENGDNFLSVEFLKAE